MRWPRTKEGPSASEGTPEGVHVVLCWCGPRHRKAFVMDSVPIYLLRFFLDIRKHSGELGYLAHRFEQEGFERALSEAALFMELRHLHLVADTPTTQTVTFHDLSVFVVPDYWDGKVPHDGVTDMRIDVPVVFYVAARGRYIWVELLTRYVVWLLTAIVCGVAGGLAVAAEGDALNAWVVAVLVGLAIPLIACFRLVVKTPKAER